MPDELIRAMLSEGYNINSEVLLSTEWDSKETEITQQLNSIVSSSHDLQMRTLRDSINNNAGMYNTLLTSIIGIDPAVIKAALEDPDKSHVDEMLAFAEQAGREYEAELAGQTPAPSPDDRETGETVRTPRGAPEKRPSIRERLAEAKRECGERKPPDRAQQKKPPEHDL